MDPRYFRSFTSNRLEALYALLKEILFSENKPFKLRRIVVSSPWMKEWVERQLALDPDIGVAFGFEVLYMGQLIQKSVGRQPTQLDLSLEIEQETGADPRECYELAHLRIRSATFLNHPPLQPQKYEGDVFVFGLNFLPAAHLHLLQQLSTKIPVYCFMLVPTPYDYTDEHPLLAKWGRLGRQLEEGGEEIFIHADEGTLIGALQQELLQVTTVEKPSDDTIQIHVAVSKRREVEIVYDLLRKAFDADSSLEPRDILIMAPDIAAYAPFLKFDLPFSISELSTEFDAVKSLLALAESRWDVATFLSFIERPEISIKLDTKQVRTWIEEVNIRWGETLEHRHELLGAKSTATSEGGTWRAGFKRLLLDDHNLIHAELLGKWIALFDDLRRDLHLLHLSQTPEDWGFTFRSLIETYFEYDRDQVERLYRLLYQFTSAPQQPISWRSAKFHFEKLLDSETFTHRQKNLQTIRCCSLLPMRAIPAKIIVLLGMEEGAFPLTPIPHPDDPLQKVSHIPKSKDFDNYLFLETLLSVRKKLIISFSADEGEPLLSPTVEVLRDYLNLEILSHPFEINVSDTLDAHPFIPEFSKAKPIKVTEIPISEFEQLFKNPLGIYFKNKLKLYPETDLSEPIQENENFFLDGLQKYFLEQEILEYGKEEALKRANERGELPPGIFGTFNTEVEALDVKTLYFSKQTREAIEESVFPAIECDGRYLTGKLTGVSKQGLYLPISGKGKELWRYWPKIVIYSQLETFPRQIFCGKTGDVLKIDNMKKWLKPLVTYYEACLSSPSPIIGEAGWETLVKNKPLKIHGKEPFNPYLSWMHIEENHDDSWKEIATKCVDLEVVK